MNTNERITEELKAFAIGPNSTVLSSICVVEFYDATLGRWVGEASGSSVAFLAGAADSVADFGAVRVRTQYGAILAGTGA